MGKTVLIVDDDLDIIKYVSKIIEKINCKIVTAKNGEEAINEIDNNRPDLVILDVLMPKQSGVKVYRELRTNDSLKDIQVIILSGISEKSFLRSQEILDEFSGQTVPVPDAYIEKPPQPEQLTKIVKDILGLS